MILKVKKSVRKQAKCVRKETEKLYEKLGGKESPEEFDTNDVLIRVDKIEEELKHLKEIVNQEKERAYLERLTASALSKPNPHAGDSAR